MIGCISTLVRSLPLYLRFLADGRSFSDVTEPNADVTGQSLGNRFFVEGGKEYSDLDELIVNHVQAIARRVEELMAHEKFKAGPEDELRKFYLPFRGDDSNSLPRPFPKELCEGQSIQECLRVHPQPQKAWTL